MPPSPGLDVVDTEGAGGGRLFAGSSEDFRRFRLRMARSEPGVDEHPSALKRQLSTPSESEAMRKVKDLSDYLQVRLPLGLAPAGVGRVFSFRFKLFHASSGKCGPRC